MAITKVEHIDMTGAETVTVNMVGAAGVSLCVTGIYSFPSLDGDAFLNDLVLFMSTRNTWRTFQVTILKSGSSSLQFHQSHIYTKLCYRNI